MLGPLLGGSTFSFGLILAVALLEERGLSRDAALSGMLKRYMELMHAGEPVHTWHVG